MSAVCYLIFALCSLLFFTFYLCKVGVFYCGPPEVQKVLKKALQVTEVVQ
jgi:hypothetical protein